MNNKRILLIISVLAAICLLLVCVTFAATTERASSLQRVDELNQLAAKNTGSNPDRALGYALEALKQADELQDRQGRSVALLQMGLANLQQGKLPEMRQYLEESLLAAQQSGYLKGQGDAYNFLGTYFWEEGMFDQALKYYTKALEIRTGLDDRIGMSKSINNLGLVQRKIGNYDKALESFRRSLDLKENADATGRCNTLVNLAVTLLEMKNYEQALQTLEQARRVGVEAGYVQGQAFALRSMGDVQLERNFLPEALVHYAQAMQLYEQAGYSKGLAFSLYGAGRTYEGLGNNQAAMEHLLRALRLAEQIEQKKLMADIYYHAAQVSKAEHNNQAAFAFYEENIQTEQKISQAETKRRIALQQVSYDTEKQQQEIDELTRQAERKALEGRNRDNLLLLAALSLLLLGAIALYLRQQLQIKHKKEQELLAVTKRLEEAKEKLAQLAKTDYLTNLANRRHFDEQYRENYAMARADSTPLTVIMADIDFFKDYNDFYGHQQGDECLVMIAKALRATMREGEGVVARYGGEEFVIIAQVGPLRGTEYAESAREEIESLGIEHKRSPYGIITCSFGVASIGELATGGPEELLNQADQALYLAKSAGRNCVRFFA